MNMNIECPFSHEEGDYHPIPCQAGAVSVRKVIPFLVDAVARLEDEVFSPIAYEEE